MNVYILIAVLVTGRVGCILNDSLSNYTFPKDFLFGAATSAYQIEGAWNVDGKGVSIWDTFTHTHPERIVDHSNGDDADKSYYKYKEDVKALKEMGMNFYRFSVAWTRIMHTGMPNHINKKGIEYYNNLINELLKNGISPMITMFHWDLPQNLQNLGGWTNEAIIPHFTAYARVLYENFGDRVKLWITINEPQYISLGYEIKDFPPGVFTYGVGVYLSAHNIIKAHAQAYHLYNNEFRDKQKGRVSFAPSCLWGMPLNKESSGDKEATNIFMQFYLGLFTHPIYSEEGDYPTVVKEMVANNSKSGGYETSRLPVFTKEEINYIKGTADFFAVNIYTATLVQKIASKQQSYLADMGLTFYRNSNWTDSNSSIWEAIAPLSVRDSIRWIKEEYGDKWEVLVTENGFADRGQKTDTMRIIYLTTYLSEILKAMYIDHCKVIGYTVWSLLDNFEWSDGYTSKWGLYSVDYSDPERPRTPKLSASFMKNLTATRQLPQKYLNFDNQLDDEILSSKLRFGIQDMFSEETGMIHL